jgi:hypothetical protein
LAIALAAAEILALRTIKHIEGQLFLAVTQARERLLAASDSDRDQALDAFRSALDVFSSHVLIELDWMLHEIARHENS